MKNHQYLLAIIAGSLIMLLAACDSPIPLPIPLQQPTRAPTAIAATATAVPTPVPPTSVPSPVTTPRATLPPPTPTSAQPSPTATRAIINMRTVDWFTVVTTDANLKYDPTIAPPPGIKVGPWVQLKSNTFIQGHALVESDRILYLDMSSDGQEEAVISIFSGGTAGNFGLLIYTAVNNAPLLADSIPGYKIGGVAEGDKLKVIEPIYQGWEPNCCPSGFFESRYRLEGNKVVELSRDEKPLPEARKMTVEKFYELLSAKNYADAYNNFLSRDYRATHPYNGWVAGYGNTVSFTVTTADLPDGRVKVDITAIDKTASGGRVTKKFTGSWTLVWYSTARVKQWVLDKGQFVQVK